MRFWSNLNPSELCHCNLRLLYEAVNVATLVQEVIDIMDEEDDGGGGGAEVVRPPPAVVEGLNNEVRYLTG